MTTLLTLDNFNLPLNNNAIAWQSVITADGSTNTNVEAGKGYFIDTTSAAHTIILPANPNVGDSIAIKDYAGTFGTNSVTININGKKYQGSTENGRIAFDRASVILVYVNVTEGWNYSFQKLSTSNFNPLYVTATGGTVTTSGNYKIHTFTGDGCFTVSCAGNAVGNNKVDYLIVAGGGGGGGNVSCTCGREAAGAGAGGYRESKSLTDPRNGSGLETCQSIVVTATTYPVVVGAGGTGGPTSPAYAGTAGSPSSVFEIVSAGGGQAGLFDGTNGTGGSGGGRSGSFNGALGNVPEVFPPQGSPGGGGFNAAGSGGGAGGPGNFSNNNLDSRPYAGTNGGVGVGTDINPSACVGTPGPSPTLRYFAGGGASAGCTAGTGGYGGGGDSGAYNPNPNPGAGVAGTANTGGGGGSGARGGSAAVGGAGGKGIVILRYKYQ